MIVGFHLDEFSLRGVTVATVAYAKAWSEILGNKSILIKYDNYLNQRKEINQTWHSENLAMIRYNSKNQLDSILRSAGIEALYVLCSGKKEERFTNLRFPIWIHAVFPSRIKDIHGRRYACISEWLTKESFNKRIPYVPHIVNTSEEHKSKEAWREENKIKSDAIVIGSLGGRDSFDLKLAQIGLFNALQCNKNLYFIALNHREFINHERALFMLGTDDEAIKHGFINCCDVMLHGRAQGETFGLACAEFAAAGKPILAWEHAPERHHLEHFCQKKLRYTTAKELSKKLLAFYPGEWNQAEIKKTVRKFDSLKVANLFEQVFAKPHQPINEPYFSAIDKALILKRRAIRSLRSRFSHLCQETPNSANTEIHQSNYN